MDINNYGTIIAYNIIEKIILLEALIMSNLEKFNKVMEYVWGVKNVTEIEDSFGPNEIDGWDSLSHIELVMGLEEKFEISLAVPDVSRMYTVGDIKRTLEKYGVEI
jgi:acyl carrier protein